MEQRDSAFPPPERQPFPTSAKAEKGVFDKWFKRRKNNSEQTPTDKSAEKLSRGERQAQLESQPNPDKQKKKLGAKLLGFLGVKRNRAEQQPGPETSTPRPEGQKPPAPEQSQLQPETVPIVEQASRVRRFAKIVLDKVLGAAEREHQNVKKWDGEQAKPLNTEPLVDAADDLRHAVEDLEAAMPALSPEKNGDNKVDTSDSYDSSSPDGGNYVPAPDARYSFTSQVAARVESRMRNIEQQVDNQAEQNQRTAAFALAGIGVLAVATVLIAGTEYLSHKKIKKEQKQIKKQLAEQRKQQKQQETAFANLQRQQAPDMSRRERQTYYRELSEFTHKQADVTRQTAQELRHVVEPASPVMPVRTGERQDAVVWQRQESRQIEHDMVGRTVVERQTGTEATPEQLKPLVRTESADRIEQGSWSQRHTGQQQNATGVTGTGSISGDRGQARTNHSVQSTAGSDAPQPQQPTPYNESQSWLYGAAVAALLIGFVIVFALIG